MTAGLREVLRGESGRAVLAGLCALLAGIGLGRFAYTPLIPALIDGGWFAPSAAAYLGAVHLAGYLAGALLARRMTMVAPVSSVLRAMMVLTALSFFACSAPLPFAWFSAWRLAAGIAGGSLMVLTASTVLARVPAGRRGLAGGLIVTGVGVGIAASGTLVPVLLETGLSAAWLGLGAICLLLTALAWGGFPSDSLGRPAFLGGSAVWNLVRHRALRSLYVSYCLNAVGLVAHMVFLVDFIARGLGQGIASGARYWVVFGIGAMIGPVMTGTVADRLGFRTAIGLALAIQIVTVGLLAFTASVPALLLSSFVVGAFVPGVVPLAVGRVHELAPADGDSRRVAWGLATTAFAVGQAAAAYVFSWLFDRTGDHRILFVLGGVTLAVALAVHLLSASGGKSSEST